MEFKVGDVVQLKSGGPLMTVSYVIDGHDNVRCTWFAWKEVIERPFEKAILVKVEQG